MTADQKNIVIRNFQSNAHTLKDSQRMWPRKKVCWLTAFSSVFLLAPKTIFSAGTFCSVWGKQLHGWSPVESSRCRAKGRFLRMGSLPWKGFWFLRQTNSKLCDNNSLLSYFFFSLSQPEVFLSVFLSSSSLSLFCFDGPLSGISFHCAVAALCPTDKGNDERCWTHSSFDWGIWGGVTERWLIYTW